MSTIFSRIMRGELPCEKILETEHEFAFLDINPFAEGHTLVVPKLEIARFEELPEPLAQSLIVTVQQVARAVMAAMGTTHYNISLNNGSAAGQEVPHVHFHVVPRFEGQRRARQPYAEGRIAQVGTAIRQVLGDPGPR